MSLHARLSKCPKSCRSMISRYLQRIEKALERRESIEIVQHRVNTLRASVSFAKVIMERAN